MLDQWSALYAYFNREGESRSYVTMSFCVVCYMKGFNKFSLAFQTHVIYQYWNAAIRYSEFAKVFSK